jgi:SAM-dependent methyltransferase
VVHGTHGAILACGCAPGHDWPVADYDAFAPFYDAVQGDRAEHAAYLRGLIERHYPTGRRVLELACGTGSVLAQLAGDFELTGVDRSREMLARARKKVPAARLVEADMTEVRLGETFDVVLCVYDSLNHLVTFRQWEAVFARAREHLDPGGIFVFDVNTERRLAWLASQPAQTVWFDDGNLLVIDVGEARRGVVWDIKIFEHRGGGRYRLHVEQIPEVSFPVERVRAALGRRFRRVSVYDQQRARPSPRSGRLHFVSTA